MAILPLLAGCMPAPPARPSLTGQLHNTSLQAGMTCGQLEVLRRSTDGPDRTAFGVAILWLDGVYAGRSGVTHYPEGWSLTVSQGVGATCAIAVNQSRPVLDVLAELHRQYYDKAPPR